MRVLFSAKLIPRTFVVRAMHLLKDKAYVNGEWLSAASNKTFDVKNPADGSTITKVSAMDVTDAQKAINHAYESFHKFQNLTGKERSVLLKKWHELINENAGDLAKLVTLESGKPLEEAMGEVRYGNGFVDWFAEEARRINGEIVSSPVKNKKILVERQPIGVIGMITPWNFPLAMITRKAAAALAAGCTCVIKPAEDTPLTALALADLADKAGFPQGVINVVTCERDESAKVGKLLCTSDKVAGISFTGSTKVGKILYGQCAEGVKRIGLELGGNAPFIVFKSADMNKVIPSALASKFRNCGQTCVASNRFLIQEDIAEEFVAKLKSEIEKLKVGNGLNAGIQLGPLINETQMRTVSSFVNDAISKGAKVVLGGKPLSELGPLFFSPTILTNITHDMDIYKSEVFGPVVAVITFKTEEEAISVANNTNSGLASYFFTEDVSQIFRVSKALEYGMVGVNEGMISTPEAPFGGVKESGVGREGSHLGVEEYTYYKYICLGNL